MTPIERAMRLKQILDDEVFKSAVSDVRARLIDRLENSPISDHETQHEIALMLQLLKNVVSELQRGATEIEVERARDRHQDFIKRIAEKFQR